MRNPIPHPLAPAVSHDDATSPLSSQDKLWLRYATFAGLAAFLIALISYNFVDIDIWHQMALIRESISAHHLLRADPYAYTPTVVPWVDHEWGAGAIAYLSTLWLGSRAIVALKFLVALATGFLCVRCSEVRGADFRLLGVVAPLSIFLAQLGFFAVIRAQAYSFFFTALLLLLWQLDRKRVWIWTAVWLIIFPLWVNVHGGFVVAIGLTVAHAGEQLLRRGPIRHLLVMLTGMLLEIFINPYGTAYLSYLRRALTMARPYAPEWRPVWDLGPFWTICFIVAVLSVVYALITLGLRRVPGILPLGATAVEATLHRKLLPFFAIAWLCYVPSYLTQTDAGRWFIQFTQRRSRFMTASWLVFAGVCVIAAARQEPWNLFVPQPIYPVGPVQYLAKHDFNGNLMVPFRLGSYVSWKVYPRVKVSLDSRYEEVYPDDVVESIFRFYEARPGWHSTLDAYPTDAVLVPRDARLSGVIAGTGWTRVYVDRQFELYARPGRFLPVEDWTARSFVGVFP